MDQPNLSEDASNREEKKGIETEQFDSLILSLKKKQNSDLGQPTPLRNSIDTSNIRQQPDFSIMEKKNNHIRTSNGNGSSSVAHSLNKEDSGRLADVCRRIEEVERKIAATEKEKEKEKEKPSRITMR